MTYSKRIGDYIKNKGYNLKEVARLTGLDYACLWTSLYSPRSRELRADELIPLSVFLEVDLRMFAKGNDDEEEEEAE